MSFTLMTATVIGVGAAYNEWFWSTAVVDNANAVPKKADFFKKFNLVTFMKQIL